MFFFNFSIFHLFIFILNNNFFECTLSVLYLTPANEEQVFSLNEKQMFNGEFSNGWILPGDQLLDLKLYLHFDQHSLPDTYFTNYKNASLLSSNKPIYMFFTPDKHCDNYGSHHRLEINERFSSEIYEARIKGVQLAYSTEPYFICLQQLELELFMHQGSEYWLSIITTRDLIPLWLRICLFVVLLSLSGLFSGLNLGLMSLDLAELDILKRIGTPNEQSYATKIYPLRKRGNFLLCTILLGNVLVNSTSTLILGDILSGVYAAFGSTILIVTFGEIIPQAACSKHGLAVGAYTRYITYFFMGLTCPLSYPLSIVLDKVLGKELAAIYTREKIRELMRNVKDLNEKELKIISGALDFNKKRVKEIMTRLSEVFMLDINERLDFETIAKISQQGYSRIPVYEGGKDHVVGLLHVKDFTLLDPDDNMPVKAILEFYNHKVHYCEADTLIDEMFEEFRKGETHLAFVTEVIQDDDRDPYDLCVGIVTLEDILEELVQMEIYDEFDDKKDIENEEVRQVSGRLPQDELGNEKKTLLNESDVESGVNSDTATTPSTIPKSRDNDNNTSSNAKAAHYSSNLIETSELNNKAHGRTNQSVEMQFLKGGGSEESSHNEKLKASRQKSGGTQSSSIASPHYYESQTSHDLSFFLQQQKDSGQRALISPQIRFVMFQFLSTTVKPFTSDFLTKNVLEAIFKVTSFKESRRTEPKQPPEYLYHYGKGCNYFILILCGEATIEIGKEKLEFPAGPFAYFGMNALLCGAETADQVIQQECSFDSYLADEAAASNHKSSKNSKQYVPDFSLRVDDRCVYMKLDRELWRKGFLKSRYEAKHNQITDKIEFIVSNENKNDDSKSDGSNCSRSDEDEEDTLYDNVNRIKSKAGKPRKRRSTIATPIFPRPLEKRANSERKSNEHRENYSPLDDFQAGNCEPAQPTLISTEQTFLNDEKLKNSQDNRKYEKEPFL